MASGFTTADGHGTIKVFDFDLNGDVTESSTTYYNAVTNTAFEEQAHLNSMVLLDSDTLAVAYRGADAGGFIRFYDITHNTGELIASGGPYKHDPDDGAFNSLTRVDDGTLATRVRRGSSRYHTGLHCNFKQHQDVCCHWSGYNPTGH